MSTVVRAPNHLGDLVMALPALQAIQPDAVVAPRGLTALLQLAGMETIPFASVYRTAAVIRRRHFERGVLFTPSFSTALMLALARVPARRGTNTDKRGLLLTDKVDEQLLAHTHRASMYWLLATGELPLERPTPRIEITKQLQDEFAASAPLLPTTPPPHRPIALFPGSNAPARRWLVERFREVAQRLAYNGATVLVFGGPDEAELTRAVAGDVAIDLGGRTTLPMLAAGLSTCALLISNDSGPMHLAAAVGTPTVSMWGAGDPARTGPPEGHRILRDERLPCLECVKNQCPRSGRGYILPEAYMECMQLISVEDVMQNVSS